MYTQCTECKKLHQITVEELRRFRGLHYCSQCSTRFDALVKLSDTAPEVSRSSPVIVSKPIRTDRKKPARSSFWSLAIYAGLVLFLYQIYHFEGDYFIQSKQLRPWLIKACSSFNCRLPAYRNLNELSVLQSRLSPISDNSFQLLAEFVNQASFPQPYPAIRMVLQEFNGKPFAQRTFSPDDYLQPLSDDGFMAAGEQLSIDLHIVRPETPIGGFTIDLI